MNPGILVESGLKAGGIWAKAEGVVQVYLARDGVDLDLALALALLQLQLEGRGEALCDRWQ
eukprot:1120416-Rhodomonas_salina.1